MVLETCWASGRNLAPHRIQIKVGGVHSKWKDFLNKFGCYLDTPLTTTEWSCALQVTHSSNISSGKAGAHAGAAVCTGDWSCQDDGARQTISWSVSRSACPIGLKLASVLKHWVSTAWLGATARECTGSHGNDCMSVFIKK